MFLPIFVANTKLGFSYNFVAPLKVGEEETPKARFN